MKTHSCKLEDVQASVDEMRGLVEGHITSDSEEHSLIRASVNRLAIAVEAHAKDTVRAISLGEDLQVLVGRLSEKFDSGVAQRAEMHADLRAVHAMMLRMIPKNGD